jgi:long-chain acyl-CoA synthetase
MTAAIVPPPAPPVVPLSRVERDTLTRLFFSAIDRFGSAEALRWKREGRWEGLSYRDVEIRVARTAAMLQRWGLAPGDRVAILSESRPEWPIADYAALGLGLVVVPIYPTLPPDQVEFMLRDSGARALFVSTPAQLEKVERCRSGLPGLERIALMDPGPGREGVEQMTFALQNGEDPDPVWSREFRKRALSLSPDSLATIIYTSGTTGVPKGVMLTHFNLAAMITATAQHGALPVEPGMVALSLLPLSHVLERAADYYFWDSGVTIAYAESVGAVPANLREVRPDVMVAVPRLFDKVYGKVMATRGLKGALVRWAADVGGAVVDCQIARSRPSPWLRMRYWIADLLVFSKIRRQMGGRLRRMISGGAPLSRVVGRFFLGAGLEIYEGYGLTETAPVLAANRRGDWRLGTVGHPYPGVELRIGDQGEILARGPSLMQGYWRNPQATAAAIDADGWFHTGDVGEFDSEGFLHVTDRIKDLIVTAGGKKVAPQPIENLIQVSPFVAQAIMVGDRRPYPTMLVVPDFERLLQWAIEQGLTTSDRARLCEEIPVRQLMERETLGRLQHLAQFERPKKIAILAEEVSVDTGLLTPTLKVRRKQAEQRFSGAIEALYGEEAGSVSPRGR